MNRELLLNNYIDHTNLKPDASNDQIKKLCLEAMKYNFKAVCVNPSKIKTCVETLRDSKVLICTVVGFPLGQNTTMAKVAETIDAINNGANEIDMVINISELKNFNKMYCVKEINDVVKAAQGRVVKVIVETALLNEREKRFAFEVVNASNAHYIKTSTGFAAKGAQIEDIEMWDEMREASKSKLKIKAAGGISSYNELIVMILRGSDRVGCSRSAEIFKDNSIVAKIEAITEYRINGVSINKIKREIKTGEVVTEKTTKELVESTNKDLEKDKPKQTQEVINVEIKSKSTVTSKTDNKKSVTTKKSKKK